MTFQNYQRARTLRNRLQQLRADDQARNCATYFMRMGIRPYAPRQRVITRRRNYAAIKFMALAALFLGGYKLGCWLRSLLW